VTPGRGVLSGRTVVVTRSGPRAAGLTGALERIGAVTIELPLTRQVDPTDGGAALRAAAAAADRFAWIVFTSANAVERFVAARPGAPGFGAAHLAAVGPATAEALRAAGAAPDLVPTVHSGRGLVEAFPPAQGDPRGVLFPAADLAPGTISEGLGGKGWDVERVEAYRTVTVAPPDDALVTRVAAADALVLFATSSVRAFVALRTAAGAAVPVPPHVVCVGASTADAARAAGMPGVHEAPSASTEGVVAELSEHFGQAGPGPGPGSGAAPAS
jgi:uroporphyrinogen-III synthase